MRIPDPYFEGTPYGDLKMEQIVVEYIYPLLSILIDNDRRRYLCICFKTEGSQEWIVTPIQDSEIKKLLTNNLTINAPFLDMTTKKLHIVRSYETLKETYYEIKGNEISKEWLPADGELLDAEEGEWSEYINTHLLSYSERSYVESFVRTLYRFALPIFELEYNISKQTSELADIVNSVMLEFSKVITISDITTSKQNKRLVYKNDKSKNDGKKYDVTSYNLVLKEGV